MLLNAKEPQDLAVMALIQPYLKTAGMRTISSSGRLQTGECPLPFATTIVCFYVYTELFEVDQATRSPSEAEEQGVPLSAHVY